ncbi:PREDICTED: uncharacterized protein LOC109471557 [Branchiostoma belcheri]|uniref:Uncharacterized protein LOC109471557 n=1 Tax=Branchiostoma belcheri TaxID=7741 RepID=A0A6P4Z9Y1_BRABE|nr:PREDICTED: uncharacterized protein LOC109471557 [Branchiostoma belcheri]XP_019626467.1 PREDICTED: uncharacterized protein LOC109471557 [Branchiostoma belcheri]
MATGQTSISFVSDSRMYSSGDDQFNRGIQQVAQSTEEGGGDGYSYQDNKVTIDNLNKQLVTMEEQLNKNSMRAHMLNCELAMQYDPVTLTALNQCQESCERCEGVMSDTARAPNLQVHIENEVDVPEQDLMEVVVNADKPTP